ncbi:MAG: arginine deiminase family protein [Lysobacteraceae bacterium]
MDTLTAIVKRPASTLADDCELTFLARTPISFDALEHQHLAYRNALDSAGAKLIALDADPTLPDSVFVEDTAVVLDELAVLARPGAVSRRPEPDRIAASIARFRCVSRIVAPGMLEGGDVLRIGRKLFVGLSNRSDRAGVEQLAALARPHGYEVIAIPVTGCLHLKTACTALDAETLLINPVWLDAPAFTGFRLIATCGDEPFAANVLPVGNALIVNPAFPRTLERVHAHASLTGQRIIPVDISEFGKAEAGLTCMSLVFSNLGDGSA